MATAKLANLDRAEQCSDIGEWAVSHAPGVNTKATITQAAPAAGKRNIVRSIVGVLAGGTTAPAATVGTLTLVDGASGGTVLQSWTVTIQALAGYFSSIQLTGLSIEMSAATATTLEFSAAGGANTFESVSMTGHVRNVQITEP